APRPRRGPPRRRGPRRRRRGRRRRPSVPRRRSRRPGGPGHRSCPRAADGPGPPCRPPRGRGRRRRGGAPRWWSAAGPRPAGPRRRRRGPAWRPAARPAPHARRAWRPATVPASGVLSLGPGTLGGADLLRADLTGLELGEEPVDDAALARLLLEGLPDDAAGQVGREATHLGTQLHDRLLALGLDLLVRQLGDAPGLGLRLLAHLGHDLGALLLGVLADAGRLLAGLGQLRLVLAQDGRGLLLRLL